MTHWRHARQHSSETAHAVFGFYLGLTLGIGIGYISSWL